MSNVEPMPTDERIVLIVFALLALAALIFGFLRQVPTMYDEALEELKEEKSEELTERAVIWATTKVLIKSGILILIVSSIFLMMLRSGIRGKM